MYYIPLFFMIPLCIAEFTGFVNKKLIFYMIFSLLLIGLCFRYGQGTDYFAYMFNYYNGDNHSEIGYRIICEIFKKYGGRFEQLIFIISVFQMFSIYRAIKLYSPYKLVSLLILYPTVYLTYFCSAIRQGIVAAFFLGFMVKWLIEKKYLRYVVGCIVLSTIHSASLILLGLILVRIYSFRFLYLCLLCSGVLGCVIYFVPTNFFSFIKIGAFQYQIQNTDISYIGLIERIALFIFITCAYKSINKSSDCYENVLILYKVYFIGFIISIALFPWGLVSSRLPMMMKAVEIVLVPILIKESKIYRQIFLTCFLAYSLVMTTKNLYSYIAQGPYIGYNAINYPYLNILDKEKAHMIYDDNMYIIHMRDLGFIEKSHARERK